MQGRGKLRPLLLQQFPHRPRHRLCTKRVSRTADNQHHARSNSVKKPTTFKAVSVTKNFLAKSVTGTPTLKGVEKGLSPFTLADLDHTDAAAVTAAGQNNTITGQSAKPRLVAKSGSGSVPRLSKPNSLEVAGGCIPVNIGHQLS